MMLLSFTVRNHKSIRDEVTLDLRRTSLRTLQPKDGDWGGATYRIAGIFGGNGTGKSTIIDAMVYAMAAIRDSSTTWQASKTMRRAPFHLVEGARDASSTYELDFVLDGRRHQYGFEVDAAGIVREWLRDIPSRRWRTLLERDRDLQTMEPRIEVTSRELVLSRALQLPQSAFHGIAKALVDHFDVVLVHHSYRESRLKVIADMLADGAVSFADLQSLLHVADIGVDKVSLEERNLPEHVFRAYKRFIEVVSAEGDEGLATSGAKVDDEAEELDDPSLEMVVRNLLFTHRGADEDCAPFSIDDESDGTIAWLAVAVPALETLRRGGLLLVDEIDASLHPHLLDLLLEVFENSEINTHGAQIVFTSHESYILSPLSEVALEPEQVWFTDKGSDGETHLSCLAEFPRHRDANVAKRYLGGRYGGTPRLSPHLFAALVTSERSQ